jgi:coenzyme F420 hydrogenase subunit beta
VAVCPGFAVDGDVELRGLSKTTEADHEFGPCLEIWEGCAADPEIRYKASSGGLLTALALYALERAGMAYVLHTEMDDARPWLNRTARSRSRAELLGRAGSRYAPASPCEALGDSEETGKPFVFIGKPCDAAGAAMLRRRRERLDASIGLSLTFFCAGTPSTRGTLDLIEELGARPPEVASLRYRGEGWPGRFTVVLRDRGETKSLSYRESWGRLTKYRPFRCHLCPDGLGRVADIACGDAWNRPSGGEDAGRSLVLVRTPRGREALRGAAEAGYVRLDRVDASVVLAAQDSLLERRRQLFGRLLAMRSLAIPTPKFSGFSLWRSWGKRPLAGRMRDVLGTMRRLLQRGLWRRHPIRWDDESGNA